MEDQSVLTLANNSADLDADVDDTDANDAAVTDEQTPTEATTAKQPRARRENRNYVYCDEYPTLEEAVERLKLEKIWSLVRVNKGHYGRKYFYRCNLAKFRAVDCAAAAYIQ